MKKGCEAPLRKHFNAGAWLALVHKTDMCISPHAVLRDVTLVAQKYLKFSPGGNLYTTEMVNSADQGF